MGDCQCNGRCMTEDFAGRLLRAARRQLRNEEPSSFRSFVLLGEIHALEVVLAGDPGGRIVAPLVKPGAVCAIPADGAEACPS